MNPQNYTINIRPGWGISPVVKVSQGDVGRPLAFAIMDGQDALTIASGTTVTLKGTKPSTLGFTQACELSGNTASVETTATMTQEAGAVQAELILTQGTTVIGSANFVMYVEPAAHPEGTTDGDTETARDLMTRAEQAVEQAEAAAEQAEASAEAISQAGIDTTGATAGQVPTANGAGGWTWEDPQGAGGGTSDDIENKSSVSGTTVTGALNSLSDEIASVEGGAPTQAQTVAQMVDTSKVYLYTGSEEGYIFGAWYHYNGTDWVYGGMYGEAASMSAGVKAALLACFQKVAWIDDQGQTYYDNLYNELYPPANLVSITAVYTQSGTVYDTASLDNLKTDLVVTANYSDGTSETVSDYTLSGTLAAGTSTITVEYASKTATFNVTVTASPHEPVEGAYAIWDARDYTVGQTWNDRIGSIALTPTGSPAKSGNAVVFDGTAKYFDFGSLSLSASPGVTCIQCSFKLTDLTKASFVIADNIARNSKFVVELRPQDGVVRVQSTAHTYNFPYTFDTEWHLLTLKLGTANKYAYIDETLLDSVTGDNLNVAPQINGATALKMGAYPTYNVYSSAYIRSVYIYTKVLSDEDIANNYGLESSLWS